MKMLVRSSVLGLALMLGCATAHAVPISFRYAGTVNFAQFNPTYGGAAPAQIGDRVVFTYTFQSNAAPEAIFPWRTRYVGQGPLRAEVYRTGAQIGAWTVPLIDISIVDNLNTAFAGYVGYDDRYEVQGSVPDAEADPLPFAVTAFVGLLEHDVFTGPNAIQGTALPLVPPDPSSFGSARLGVSRAAEVPLGGGVFQVLQHWYFSAAIDSFGIVRAVPEPTTLLLLVAGLAALAAGRRLRRVRAARSGIDARERVRSTARRRPAPARLGGRTDHRATVGVAGFAAD